MLRATLIVNLIFAIALCFLKPFTPTHSEIISLAIPITLIITCLILHLKTKKDPQSYSPLLGRFTKHATQSAFLAIHIQLATILITQPDNILNIPIIHTTIQTIKIIAIVLSATICTFLITTLKHLQYNVARKNKENTIRSLIDPHQ